MGRGLNPHNVHLIEDRADGDLKPHGDAHNLPRQNAQPACVLEREARHTPYARKPLDDRAGEWESPERLVVHRRWCSGVNEPVETTVGRRESGPNLR